MLKQFYKEKLKIKIYSVNVKQIPNKVNTVILRILKSRYKLMEKTNIKTNLNVCENDLKALEQEYNIKIEIELEHATNILEEKSNVENM